MDHLHHSQEMVDLQQLVQPVADMVEPATTVEPLVAPVVQVVVQVVVKPALQATHLAPLLRKETTVVVEELEIATQAQHPPSGAEVAVVVPAQ